MTRWQAWRANFYPRGGLWVAAQFPLLALALLLPWWTGAGIGQAAAWATGLGWLLVAAGGFLFVAAASTLGRYFTPFPEPLTHTTLRTDGVYAWVRHPTYTGVLCMALGWSLVNASLWGGALTPVLFVFFDRKAVHEERRLQQLFPAYADYQLRVRKLIPWIY